MDDLPRGLEQRLVLRLLSLWRDACGFERFPSFDRMQAARIDDIWAHRFVIDLSGVPTFRELGEDFAAHTDGSLLERPVEDAPADTLIGHALTSLADVVKREVPISRGGRFINANGTEVLFRSIILPLSEDGKSVDTLFGAANCRTLSAQDMLVAEGAA